MLRSVPLSFGGGAKVADASSSSRPPKGTVLPELSPDTFAFEDAFEGADTFDCQLETRPDGKLAFVFFRSLSWCQP
jgi:hypothetical protein